jgi:DNA-binding winged helix-turn-helix (wHTH) protein
MRYKWADCELDRDARELLRNGRPVAVQALVLDLLLLLLEHRGRVVTEKLVRRRLWPDVRVTDASLRRVLKEARRAIGDDGARQAQIQTLRGRGFRFAAPVTDEEGGPSFVGREAVFAALDRTLDAVLSGRGSVTLLHGPAGIGKTRLLAELEARAEARDFRILSGAGRPGAEGDAFHPWLEACAELDLERLLRPELPSESPVTEDGLRFARFREVSRALLRAAERRPLLIAFDDLHAADGDTLILLRFVARSLRRGRVWIVGTVRAARGMIGEGQQRELAELAADSATQVLAVPGLETAELRTLLARELPAASEDARELLCARTEGNPLFALELARFVRDHAHAGDLAELARTVSLGLREFVARRWAALGSKTRRVLLAASALGMQFDPAIIREAEGITSRAQAQSLEEATAAGLLEPDVRKQRRFTHPLFLEGLYAELSSEPRAAAAQHLRIAEALERRGVTDAFLLARHFVAARSLTGPARALGYARAAAKEASQRYAWADARLWYHEAVELAEQAGAPAGELGELLLAESELLLVTQGLLDARVLSERAARLAENEGDGELLARAALAYASRPFALEAQEPVLRWLRAARARPAQDESLGARVASRLGAELAVAGHEHALEAEALVREAEQRARRLGDPLTLSRVLFDVNAASFAARDSRAWLARAEEVRRCAARSHDLELELRSLPGVIAVHLQLGERAGAQAGLEACRAFMLEHPSGYGETVIHCLETMFALLDGGWQQAQTGIDRTEAFARRTQSSGFLAVASGQRFWLALEQDRLETVMPLVEAIATRFPRFWLVAALRALAHVRTGQLEPALTGLGRIVEAIPSMAHDWNRLPALCLCAEVSFRASAPIAAAALELELAPHAALGAVAGNASQFYGSVSQALGWLAAARGRTAVALEHFERAHEMHTSLRSPPWCQRTERAIDELKPGRRATRRIS